MAARKKKAETKKAAIETDPRQFNVAPCPFCGETPDLYNLAEMGLIRCEPCGVKMQAVGGLPVVVMMWGVRS